MLGTLSEKSEKQPRFIDFINIDFSDTEINNIVQILWLCFSYVAHNVSSQYLQKVRTASTYDDNLADYNLKKTLLFVNNGKSVQKILLCYTTPLE